MYFVSSAYGRTGEFWNEGRFCVLRLAQLYYFQCSCEGVAPNFGAELHDLATTPGLAYILAMAHFELAYIEGTEAAKHLDAANTIIRVTLGTLQSSVSVDFSSLAGAELRAFIKHNKWVSRFAQRLEDIEKCLENPAMLPDRRTFETPYLKSLFDNDYWINGGKTS